MIKKEIIWFSATAILSLVVILILNWAGIITEGAVSVNIYDTYFVTRLLPIYVLTVLEVFFIVYLIRSIYSRFKIKCINIIFILVTILSVLALTRFIAVLESMISIILSGDELPYHDERKMNFEHWSLIFKSLILFIQFLLLVLLAFTGVKTGRLYKNQNINLK